MCLIYVLDVNGSPLMPTQRPGRVRHLLKDGKAKIVNHEPFTIQLTYKSTEFVQPVTLGVDAGSKHIGLSASTEKQELYSGEVEMRKDVSKLLSSRREARRTRRNRLRYRPARFDNRTATKPKGWLAPSVEHKIETHITVIGKVCRILPVSKIVVEVAAFDTQLLKAEEEGRTISGTDYQNGEMRGWNIREYVLFRDNHKCQHCHGKSGDKVLEVHHLESRKTGGNAPNNLITLCSTCHKKYHKGEITLKQKRGRKYDDIAFMGIMRWTLYERLKEKNPCVKLTYGYITKHNRIRLGLSKQHYNDAFCIAGNFDVKPLPYIFCLKKVRCHNRKIHKSKILKKGKLKRNQTDYLVHGFRLFDKVKAPDGTICFIYGRRDNGYFDIRKLDGTTVNAGISWKKLKLVALRKSYLIEKRVKASECFNNI